MTDTPENRRPSDPDRPGADRPDADQLELLEAFNAEGVVEHPGRPEEAEPPSTASEADAPPPPG